MQSSIAITRDQVGVLDINFCGIFRYPRVGFWYKLVRNHCWLKSCWFCALRNIWPQQQNQKCTLELGMQYQNTLQTYVFLLQRARSLLLHGYVSWIMVFAFATLFL